MTTTPQEPVGDDDIETVTPASSQPGPADADGTDGGDADGTDSDSSDGDSTDSSDGDSSDDADADGTDA